RPPLTVGLYLQPGIGISERRQFRGKEIFAWNLQHPGQKGLIRHVESPDLAINHGTAMARRLRQMLRDAGVFEAGVLHDFSPSPLSGKASYVRARRRPAYRFPAFLCPLKRGT